MHLYIILTDPVPVEAIYKILTCHSGAYFLSRASFISGNGNKWKKKTMACSLTTKSVMQSCNGKGKCHDGGKTVVWLGKDVSSQREAN